MGQDYYACTCCDDAFGDYSYHVSCYCGNMWCCDECADVDGFIEDDETGESSCDYCRGDKFPDEVLLTFALEILNMDHSQLLEKYKNSIK